MKPHILVTVGTRPELIKLASVIRALRSDLRARSTVIFTGQHASLIDAASVALAVKPDIEIPQRPTGRSLTELLAQVVEHLGRFVQAERPSCVVVQGDTVSALAGALTAELYGIPLVHVEAGVRSKARDDPFPEETIRRIISPISELHLCFSEGTRRNLLLEGISPHSIEVMPHPLLDRIAEFQAPDRPAHNDQVLVTLHRRERRSDRLEAFMVLATELVRPTGSIKIKFVWHPSLDTSHAPFRARLEAAGVQVVDPMEPSSFLSELFSSGLVLTDSAGVAEEAHLLSIPIVVFRTSAELRMDETPASPTLVTESASSALGFVLAVMREPTERRSQVSRGYPSGAAGAAIADAIVRFAASAAEESHA